MKNLKYGYFVAGGFAAVGVILYAIVICENIFNTSLSPDWVTTLKVIGIVAFACAILAIVATLLVAVWLEKKADKKPVASDEELLAKYRSNKSK